MSDQVNAYERTFYSSVPPIFAAQESDDHKPSPPVTPKHPEQGSHAPKRPEDTDASGYALSGAGEDNHQSGKDTHKK